jgi:hypothetical protein
LHGIHRLAPGLKELMIRSVLYKPCAFTASKVGY